MCSFLFFVMIDVVLRSCVVPLFVSCFSVCFSMCVWFCCLSCVFRSLALCSVFALFVCFVCVRVSFGVFMFVRFVLFFVVIHNS